MHFGCYDQLVLYRPLALDVQPPLFLLVISPISRSGWPARGMLVVESLETQAEEMVENHLAKHDCWTAEFVEGCRETSDRLAISDKTG
jgi:hypothetical protein